MRPVIIFEKCNHCGVYTQTPKHYTIASNKGHVTKYILCDKSENALWEFLGYNNQKKNKEEEDKK